MIELRPHDLAHGGEAVARADGKTWFVADAMPGDVLLAEVQQDKGSWGRARLIELLEPAGSRVDPPCPHFSSCGGCQWQFMPGDEQRAAKQRTVMQQLAHLGGIETEVAPTEAVGPDYAYRNRMDFRVADGRPALYRRRSRELEPLTRCDLVVPPLAALFGRLGDLAGLTSLTLRAGVATGDLLAVVTGRLPASASEWGVPVARVRRGLPTVEVDQAHLTESVAGFRFLITANAFFQNNTAGAERLVELVAAALAPQPDDVLLDAYAGGGLFSVTIGRRVSRIIAVETSPLGLADLATNLEAADGPAADILPHPVEEVGDEIGQVDLAVCDPPRQGLGAAAADSLVAGEPRTIAYVSCDPASFARDARLLAGLGYRLEHVTPVDLFPQTHHIELVGRFTIT